jgi:co-chaperonin GroES (HSP10)
MEIAAPKRFARGSRLGAETLTHIPAKTKIHPTFDHIIVEPLDACISSIIYVINEDRPIRGIVRAVGKGIYEKKYDHPDKHKRTKTWDSKAFRPTEVKVGDTVELGGSEIGGYAFQTFYWGDRIHLICSERDVAAIHLP